MERLDFVKRCRAIQDQSRQRELQLNTRKPGEIFKLQQEQEVDLQASIELQHVLGAYLVEHKPNEHDRDWHDIVQADAQLVEELLTTRETALIVKIKINVAAIDERYSPTIFKLRYYIRRLFRRQ